MHRAVGDKMHFAAHFGPESMHSVMVLVSCVFIICDQGNVHTTHRREPDRCLQLHGGRLLCDDKSSECVDLLCNALIPSLTNLSCVLTVVFARGSPSRLQHQHPNNATKIPGLGCENEPTACKQHVSALGIIDKPTWLLLGWKSFP